MNYELTKIEYYENNQRFKKMTYLNIIDNYNVKSPDTVADSELGKFWDNLFQETVLKPKLKRGKN